MSVAPTVKRYALDSAAAAMRSAGRLARETQRTHEVWRWTFRQLGGAARASLFYVYEPGQARECDDGAGHGWHRLAVVSGACDACGETTSPTSPRPWACSMRCYADIMGIDAPGY